MKWAIPKSNPDLLVSESGTIVRMASSRRVGSRWQEFPRQELKPRLIAAGYLAICRKAKGKSQTFYIHRLVAEAFHGSPWCGAEVNHIDGQKTNNHASNLEWVTHSQNHIHAAHAGLSPCAKITPETARAIKERLACGDSIACVASELGVSRSTVTHIKHGRTWREVAFNGDSTVQESRG